MQTWDDEDGWPFWAPTDLAAFDRALDLAELRPGERFVDLGCGDGRLLVAAGQRGAEVIGVEIDEELAEQARAALDANGLAGKVIVDDLLEVELDVDVVFTYLAPATLQRVLPRLRAQRGARVVTLDFRIPDLVPNAVVDRSHLYRMPGRLSRARRPGWEAPGTLVVTNADRPSLTCIELHHPGGPVRLRVGRELRSVGAFRTGRDQAERGRPVAIDIRWEPTESDVVATGSLRVEGLHPHHLTVAFTDDERTEGVWHLAEDGIANLTRALRQSTGRPATGPELLQAAEG